MRITRPGPLRHYFAMVLAAVCSIAACANSQDTSNIQEQVNAVVEEYQSGNPGVLAAMVHVDLRGQKSYKATRGFFEISKTRAINATDRFLIGSITKVFTATLVHQLIERGQVQRDGLLVDYLSPEWATLLRQTEYGGQITVEQALSHRTGVTDVLSREVFAKYVLADPSPLFGIFAQQPFGDHVGHVLTGDTHLLEASLDPPYRVSHKLEARAVKERFLNAGHKAKTCQAAGLAQFAQEG